MIRYLPQMPTLGENYHLDPGVEQNTNSINTQWWTNYFACPRVRDNTDKHSGTWCAKYTRSYDATNAGQQGAVCWSLTRTTGWRGKYRVSGWFKVTAGANWKISARVVRSNNVTLTENGGQVGFIGGGTGVGQWVYCESLLYVIDQPVIIGLQAVILGNQAAGLEMWIDDIKIEQVSTT